MPETNVILLNCGDTNVLEMWHAAEEMK